MLIQTPLVHTGRILPLGSISQIRVLEDQFSLQPSTSIGKQPDSPEPVCACSLHDHIQIDLGECQVQQEYWIPQNSDNFGSDHQLAGNLLRFLTDIAEKPEVILFLVDRNDLESFRRLDYWLHFATQWIANYSEVILFSYASNPQVPPSVSEDTIANAGLYLEQEIAAHLKTWMGSCTTINMGNPSQLTTAIARNLISRRILQAKGLSIMEGVVCPVSSFSDTFA